MESKSSEIGLRDELCSKSYYKYISPIKMSRIKTLYMDAKQKNKTYNSLRMSIYVNEPANCIREYLFKEFGGEAGLIIGFGTYIHYSEGYAYFTGLNVKRSRYIMARELGFEESLPWQYVVHHIDLNKLNDKIKNLFPVYDSKIHGKIHRGLYESFYDKSCITFENIREFVDGCVKDRLKDIDKRIILPKSDKNKLEKKRQLLLQYLNTLDKLEIARYNSPVF